MATTENPADRFHRLFWPHRATVLRTARFLVRDPSVAEDLAQEAMLKAFRSMRQFSDTTDARAWLLTILRNARIDWLRAEAKRRGDISLSGLSQEPQDFPPAADQTAWEVPQDLLERIGDADLIDALQSLPEEIRWTLLLIEVEGLELADAAKVLDVPVGTIKSRAHRGRGMLKEALAAKAHETEQRR